MRACCEKYQSGQPGAPSSRRSRKTFRQLSQSLSRRCVLNISSRIHLRARSPSTRCVKSKSKSSIPNYASKACNSPTSRATTLKTTDTRLNANACLSSFILERSLAIVLPYRVKAMAQRNIKVQRDKLADFCRRHHITKLSFFGSVLRNDFRPTSDID